MSADLTPPDKQPAVHVDKTYGVVLPCTVDYFGEFISGLLGRKEVMDGFEEGIFNVGPQEIANVYHLITQRVAAQNHGSIVALSIKVIYSNGSSVTHASVNAFTSHHPIEPGHPVEVVVSFVFLINFKGNAVPEKQTVDISFVAHDHRWRDGAQRRLQGGGIEFRIEYTERTWASDIAALIKAHAKNLIEPASKTFMFLSDNFDQVTFVLCTLLFVLTVGGWAWHTMSVVPLLSSTVDLISYLVKSVFIFCALAGVLLSINEILRYNIFLGRSSFIVLVDSDRVYKEKRNRRHVRNFYYAVGGWLMSILASVVASYAYAYLA